MHKYIHLICGLLLTSPFCFSQVLFSPWNDPHWINIWDDNFKNDPSKISYWDIQNNFDHGGEPQVYTNNVSFA